MKEKGRRADRAGRRKLQRRKRLCKAGVKVCKGENERDGLAEEGQKGDLHVK